MTWLLSGRLRLVAAFIMCYGGIPCFLWHVCSDDEDTGGEADAAGADNGTVLDQEAGAGTALALSKQDIEQPLEEDDDVDLDAEVWHIYKDGSVNV